MLLIKNIQNVSNIHNFSLDSTIDLNSYFLSGNKVECFYISTNYDGSIIVVLIKQYNSFILLHYILEEQQYKLLHQQKHSRNNENSISNFIMNSQGNLLFIEYQYLKLDYYYKRTRKQKWTRLFIVKLDYTYFENANLHCQYQVQSTSMDLTSICLYNYQRLLVKNFFITRNPKLIYKCLLQNSRSSLISKEKNFLIFVSEYYLNIYSIKPPKLLQQLEIFDGFYKMKFDKELKLFVLSKTSLQIYEQKDNQKYRLANYIKLQIVSCIEDFTICQNQIFFFIDSSNGNYVSVFEINNRKLDNLEVIAFNSIKRFQNDLGFIALQNYSFCVFKSN